MSYYALGFALGFSWAPIVIACVLVKRSFAVGLSFNE